MISFDQVAQELRTFVVNNYLFGVATKLSDNDSFMENGLIDSTGVLELVSHLEAEYGIVVNDDELIPENLDTLNALAQYVTRKLDCVQKASVG